MSVCLQTTPPQIETHCERLDSFAFLDARRWNELAGSVPFRQWEWAETWWRHYRHNRQELFLLVVRDGFGDILGIAPWYIEHSPVWGSVVRFLGSGEVCSDFLSILCRPEHVEAVTRSMADWLAGRGRLMWDLLDLDGIDGRDPVMPQFLALMAEHGRSVHQRCELHTWRIELPATLDSWVAQLSKKRREKTRALLRRSFDTGRAVPRLARSTDEMQHAWKILQRLHHARHDSLGHSSSFATPQAQLFHQEIIERFAPLGQIRLHWVTLDDAPVAAEYALTGGNIIYMYQTGIDPAAESFRPGWLNTIGTLRHGIEQGFAAYDFMRGDEAYKASWRGQSTPVYRVRVVSGGMTAVARNQLWHAGRSFKR